MDNTINDWTSYLLPNGVKTVASASPDSSSSVDSQFGSGGVDGGVIGQSSQMTVGNGDNVAVLTGNDPTYRLWVGNAKPSLAPFSVDRYGNVTATTLNLSNYLSKTGTSQVLTVVFLLDQVR